jgi:hypothetical protein
VLKAALAHQARALLLLLLLLTACDGLFTGKQVVRFPLQPVTGGGFAPLRLTLGPEMNPVALNFSAEYTANPAEAGKWNGYVAVLSYKGRSIATGAFNINSNATPDAPAGAISLSQTMLVVEAAETGDYELSISSAGQPRITLANPNVELRRNIQRGN